MPALSTSYCQVTDLRKGDIPLPAYMGDGGGYVDLAAEEIDSQLGHLYVTPIVIPTDAQYRPSRLLLKKINMLVASGRLILDMAAAGESDNMHAYGMGMLKEGLELLKQLALGNVSLLGATRLPTDPDAAKEFTGPVIVNEDDQSLVEGFYKRHDPSRSEYGCIYPPQPVHAYGNKP